MNRPWIIPLLLCAAVSRADSPAERIGPFLDADAIAVGRLDVAGLDLDATLAALRPFLPTNLDAGALTEDRMRGMITSARAAGVREVFAVVSLADVAGEPAFVVVPVPAGADAGRLVGWAGATVPLPEVAVVRGAVITGSAATVARLRNLTDAPARPGLAEAFTAVEKRPVQLVVVPSPDHRRVLREMTPDLPPAFGGARGEELAAGLAWAAAGVSFDPKPSGTVVVQGETEAGAAAVRTAIERGLQMASLNPEVLKNVPVLPLFVASLTPQRQGSRLTLNLDGTLDAAGKLLAGIAAPAREAAGRSASMNNLKQIGLAMHQFADKYGSFPPAAGYDAAGKPLLSWRVYLLPSLDQQALYERFRLNESWDSPHNQSLIAQMPDVFHSPNVATRPGQTAYLVPTGTGTIFDGTEGTGFRDITDGTSNTVLMVEATAERAVPWTKPADLPIDPAKPTAGLTAGREAFAALSADGAVRMLPTSLDPTTFLHLLTRAGGEVADWP